MYLGVVESENSGLDLPRMGGHRSVRRSKRIQLKPDGITFRTPVQAQLQCQKESDVDCWVDFDFASSVSCLT